MSMCAMSNDRICLALIFILLSFLEYKKTLVRTKRPRIREYETILMSCLLVFLSPCLHIVTFFIVEPLFVVRSFRFALSSRSFLSKCKFSRWRAALCGRLDDFGLGEPLFFFSESFLALASRSFSCPSGFRRSRAALFLVREPSGPAEPLSALHLIIYTRARGDD